MFIPILQIAESIAANLRVEVSVLGFSKMLESAFLITQEWIPFLFWGYVCSIEEERDLKRAWAVLVSYERTSGLNCETFPASLLLYLLAQLVMWEKEVWKLLLLNLQGKKVKPPNPYTLTHSVCKANRKGVFYYIISGALFSQAHSYKVWVPYPPSAVLRKYLDL